MKSVLLSILCFLVALIHPAVADQMQPATPFVFGYPNHLSYLPGEEVALHLSSSESQIDLSIERVGAEREMVFEKEGIPGAVHPIPDRASSHGCDWPVSFRFQIPDCWKSGYYEVSLSAGNEKPASSTLFFVVRSSSPGKDTKILIQLSTNTYNAYTNWGGHSLYSYHDRDGLQGHKVSFDRPLRSQYGKWEQPFAAWAESNGYTIDYAVNSDLEFRPDILKVLKLK